jgi:hypothetical protein
MLKARWAALLLALSLTGSNPLIGKRFAGPEVMLWAWDRAEDLQFLRPGGAGVAFLAATAEVSASGGVRYQPRKHSLALPEGVSRLAVVRIETPIRHAPIQKEALIRGLVYSAELPDVDGLQIDFDARASERLFYADLLRELGKRTKRPIGVTALASWCSGDRWLDSAPVAEAVPMFFRMGAGESRGMALRSSVCQSSIGLSLDEAFPEHRPKGLRTGSRVYLFNPRRWTATDYATAMRDVEKWK